MWLRDWAQGFDVRIANLTTSLGAINVTGPRAAEVLAELAAGPLPPYLGRADVTVAGVACSVIRLSFTGELSYELHHSADESVGLWRALLEAGESYDLVPHGLAALLRLRLDKGHILVGQDSDFDSTPRRLDHEWMVDLESGDFLGRDALMRTDGFATDKQLVGLVTDGEPPFEGAVVWRGDEYAGYVTSSAWSPAVGSGVMLAWLRSFDGRLPDEVTVEGQAARRVATPFYDPEGARARA
jgi:sarcosine oxidase subunit alpha